MATVNLNDIAIELGTSIDEIKEFISSNFKDIDISNDEVTEQDASMICTSFLNSLSANDNKINIDTTNCKIKFVCVNEVEDCTQTLQTDEEIKNIENYSTDKICIDYKVALENIKLFESMIAKDIEVIITIIDIPKERIQDIQSIFNLISSGGEIIYHKMGIVKKATDTQRKEQNLREKYQIPTKFHGCVVDRDEKMRIEQNIYNFVVDELKVLQNETA
jgi:hypothetical protein